MWTWSQMLDSLVDLNTIELGEGPSRRCSVAGTIEAAGVPEAGDRAAQHNVRLCCPSRP